MWNKNKILVIFATSLLLLSFINIINIPYVKANPLVQVNSNSCGTCSTRSETFTNPVTAGDIIVVAFDETSATTTATAPTITISDTLGNSFTTVTNSGNAWHGTGFNQVFASLYYSAASIAGTDTVTASSNQASCCSQASFGITIYELSGVAYHAEVDKACTSACGTSVVTSSSISYNNGDVLVSSEASDSVCSAGAGGTFVVDNGCNGSVYVGIQHLLPSSSSTTNFPYTLSATASAYKDMGAQFIVSTVTQPLSICTQEIGTVPLGITIPLYDPPGFNSDWTTIENDATSNPSIKFTVIVNVANGAGSAQSPTFTTGINAMLAAGVRVIGYEYTTYSHRSSALVQTDIQHWTSFYPQINGIFFDQVGSTAGNASYYTALVAFASTQHYTSFYSSGNPGIAVSSSLYGIFTNLNIWEKAGTPSTTVLASSTTSPPSAFSFISNGISTGADTNSTYLNTVTPYVGNVFITSSAAYTALPSYFGTLVSNVALTASGVPSGTFALSGASPSPATLASQTKGSCTFTNITVGASQTLTITVPADTTYTRFRMNSTATSSTTQNISTCASGTCTSKTVDVYYQISNSYGVQAVNPTKFNGNIVIVLLAFNAGTAVTQNLPITLGSNIDTIGYTFFDFGTVSFPTQFTVSGQTWNASPLSAASVSNTNIGGSQFIVGYIGGNQSTSSATLTRTVIVSVVTTVTIGTSTCGNINDCSADQFGSFLSFLLPALIIIGMFEYLLFAMGVRDERAFVLVFMMIVSGICYASSLQAFGNFGIPWYIGIFVDIVGFMLIITYNRDRGITSNE